MSIMTPCMKPIIVLCGGVASQEAPQKLIEVIV